MNHRRVEGLHIKTRVAPDLKVNFVFSTDINIWYTSFFFLSLSKLQTGEA
jgi:hypothetical protein